jgi:hypothetical protein
MFVPTPGANGVIHRSKAEAFISFKLLSMSIIARDDFYPWAFTDNDGIEFRAMSDFYCPATGIYFEFKSGYMNGLKTKAGADKALARFNADKAAGFITARNHAKKLLDASWSDSVQKFKAVQYQAAEAGRCVVLIFDKKPDPKTEARLDRAQVFWCVHGDRDFRTLIAFRAFARGGWPASCILKGHIFKTAGAVPIQSPTIHLECRPDVMEAELMALKAAGYHLKDGTKTATSAVLILKTSASPPLH